MTQKVPDETREGFFELFQMDNSALYRFLSRHLESREDVADMAQEVYLRVSRKNAKTAIQYPRAYVFKTASNLLKERARKNSVRKTNHHVTDIELVSNAPSPEEVVQSRQALKIIEKSLKKLRPESRRAFALHRFDGLSYEKIAIEMSISKSMVKHHICQVLFQCRKALQGIGR